MDGLVLGHLRDYNSISAQGWFVIKELGVSRTDDASILEAALPNFGLQGQ